MQFSIVLVVLLGLTASESYGSELAKEFSSEFKSYMKTRIASERFQSIVDKLALPDAMKYTSWNIASALRPKAVMCDLCDVAVFAILDRYEAGMPIEQIRDIFVVLCEILNIQTDRVCEGVVDSNLDPWVYILDNTENLTADGICAKIMQGNDCGNDVSDEWAVDLDEKNKPEIKIQNSRAKPKGELLNVIQLTDLHYDPNYLEGGNANCDEPMCCRFDQGEPETPEGTAGKWGHYHRCDIPWEVVTDALAHIKVQHPQVDYVYMTGDLIDHGVWDTSRTRNNETFIRVVNEMKMTFGDVPVFPSIGNHEPHPMNVFAPVHITDDAISASWLYETLADLWSAWLPADTRETILKGGYYTVLVRPGFRVVSLNNNQCYTNNWWLVHDAADPDGQLKWLIGVLRQAEADGEKVHILYHIPTGSGDCYKRWSREYNRIINRYENTITAQFSGHTHNDEFHIYYSHDEPTRAINVLFTGGSLTSYTNTNGNYRLYQVDDESWEVIDHETWIYNMTEANLGPSETIPWQKMYSFKEAYGVDSLSPVDLDLLAQRMATDEDLMQQYFRFYNLLGDPKLADGCDQGCLEGLLCGIVKSDSSDSSRCDELIGTFRAKYFH